MGTVLIPDYVNTFFRAHPESMVRPSMRLADGATISVQASRGHYCSPREDRAEPYSAVEVYCWPTKRCPAAFAAHGGSNHNPAGWVPVEVVNRWIHRRGGLAK